MSTFPTLKYSLTALLVFTLIGATASRADEPPKKDDALDRLLEKLEEKEKSPKPEAKAASEPAKAKDQDKAKGDAKTDASKDQDKAKGDAKTDASKDKDKPKGDVAPKDQALDSLLEKLGETRDKPETEDERRGGPSRPGEGDPEGKGKGKGDEPMPPKPDQPANDDLTGRDKSLDERLEELTGRKRQRKDREEEEGGALSQVIKEMREVEQRLGKPDTGEETRKKQTEIVKNLEQIIEQLRQTSSQSKSQKKTEMAMKPGQKPGSQDGQTPGANPGGAPKTKPAKPESKHAFVNGKDEWGHLPADIRQELDNVAKEEMLPGRHELIRLYFLSLQKKNQSREE